MKKCFVRIDNVERTLKKIPKHILINFSKWVEIIETFGLNEMKKTLGFHDEALKGKRKGERSVRLSKSYRAIYRKVEEEELIIIDVIKVSKHDYA